MKRLYDKQCRALLVVYDGFKRHWLVPAGLCLAACFSAGGTCGAAEALGNPQLIAAALTFLAAAWFFLYVAVGFFRLE